MMIEMVKRSMTGIAFGGIATFGALTIMKILSIEASINEVWMNMSGSLIIGIYFGLSSFIFERNVWSPLKRTIIHYCLSLFVYYCVAIPVGWVPFTPLYLGLGLILFTIIYVIFWLGSYLYYKYEINSLNTYLKDND